MKKSRRKFNDFVSTLKNVTYFGFDKIFEHSFKKLIFFSKFSPEI